MEDTQAKQVDPKREAMIAEMLRDAESQKIEPESDLTRNRVLNRDKGGEPPTVVTKVSSAGYVPVWDNQTYVKAMVLFYMLPQVLRKTRKDGSYRWTPVDPGKKPQRGAYKCILHADDPNREHYKSLGFRECPKENITSPYQVTQHMKSRHKREWAAIEQERTDAERVEDRNIQKMLAEALAGRVKETTEVPSEPVEKAPLYVSKKDKIK